MTYLDCNNNQLTKLDVSKNTKLTSLYCYGNKLTTLDLSNNTKLFYLQCSNNRLTNLNVSKNTALRELYCYDNQLTGLDISKIPNNYQIRYSFYNNPGTILGDIRTFSLSLRADQKSIIGTQSWTFEGKTVNVDFNITE